MKLFLLAFPFTMNAFTFNLKTFPSSSKAFYKDSFPGKGMSEHPFLYAGEWQDRSMKEQKMYIVRHGTIAWSYTMPGEGEYGDVSMLSNGNIVFSRKAGATEITQDKRIIWDFKAPPDAEIHTCQPLGINRVFIMLNAVPAKAMIINTKTNKVEKELVIPTGGANTHGMFRHCRYTKAGTFLIAHMDMNKVVEYDEKGNTLWTVDAKSPWAAVRLKNGNTLISGNQYGYVREVNKEGITVWEFNREDAPSGMTIYTIQEASRLSNGNTLISNWCEGANLTDEERKRSVQFFEVTPTKKVVWALSQWDLPNLGPATSMQRLDEKGKAEEGDFQR